MADANAASSPAVYDGPEGLAEFIQWRQSGNKLPEPEPAETAESAPADAPEETVESEDEKSESASESESEEEAQEPPQKGSGAEKRIKQLLARVKELERAQAAKQDVKPESSTAQPQQAAPGTRTKPTPDGNGPDGKPYASYEAYVEDLADWKSEQRLVQFQQQQAEQQALNALRATLEEARSRYEDADEVIFPAAQAIRDAQIPQAIKEVFAQSDTFVDLCYVLGSDPDELQKFVSLAQKNPRAALAKVFEYERGIREEFSKPRDAEGKFAAEKEPQKAPEKRQTQAPKPPSPVGGGSSRAFDVNDESLSNDEWARKRNAERQKRGYSI